MIQFQNPDLAKKLKDLIICMTIFVLVVAAFIVNSVVNRRELARTEEKLEELIELEQSGADPTASKAIIKELELTSDELATLIKIETETMADQNSAFAKLRSKKRNNSDSASNSTSSKTKESPGKNDLTERDAEIEALAKSHNPSSKSTVGGFLRGIQQYSEHSDGVALEDDSDDSPSDAQDE